MYDMSCGAIPHLCTLKNFECKGEKGLCQCDLSSQLMVKWKVHQIVIRGYIYKSHVVLARKHFGLGDTKLGLNHFSVNQAPCENLVKMFLVHYSQACNFHTMFSIDCFFWVQFVLDVPYQMMKVFEKFQNSIWFQHYKKGMVCCNNTSMAWLNFRIT